MRLLLVSLRILYWCSCDNSVVFKCSQPIGTRAPHPLSFHFDQRAKKKKYCRVKSNCWKLVSTAMWWHRRSPNRPRFKWIHLISRFWWRIKFAMRNTVQDVKFKNDTENSPVRELGPDIRSKHIERSAHDEYLTTSLRIPMLYDMMRDEPHINMHAHTHTEPPPHLPTECCVFLRRERTSIIPNYKRLNGDFQ